MFLLKLSRILGWKSTGCSLATLNLKIELHLINHYDSVIEMEQLHRLYQISQFAASWRKVRRAAYVCAMRASNAESVPLTRENNDLASLSLSLSIPALLSSYPIHPLRPPHFASSNASNNALSLSLDSIQARPVSLARISREFRSALGFANTFIARVASDTYAFVEIYIRIYLHEKQIWKIKKY